MLSEFADIIAAQSDTITALQAEIARLSKFETEIRKYIYDPTPARREWVIRKFGTKE